MCFPNDINKLRTLNENVPVDFEERKVKVLNEEKEDNKDKE